MALANEQEYYDYFNGSDIKNNFSNKELYVGNIRTEGENSIASKIINVGTSKNFGFEKLSRINSKYTMVYMTFELNYIARYDFTEPLRTQNIGNVQRRIADKDVKFWNYKIKFWADRLDIEHQISQDFIQNTTKIINNRLSDGSLGIIFEPLNAWSGRNLMELAAKKDVPLGDEDKFIYNPYNYGIKNRTMEDSLNQHFQEINTRFDILWGAFFNVDWNLVFETAYSKMDRIIG